MSLFNAWYTKSSTFDEFEIAQNQTIDQSGNGLRDNWVTAVQLAFKSSFKDVGETLLTSCMSAQMGWIMQHPAQHVTTYMPATGSMSNTACGALRLIPGGCCT